MPLKLNVGLSKKVGLPNYGSLGASCHVEVELDHGLIFQDQAAWQHKVEQAFEACRAAVDLELQRAPPACADEPVPAAQTCGEGPSNGRCIDHYPGQSYDQSRPVTPRQLRAIEGIALRQRLNLLEVLESRFGKYHLTSLSRSEASRLIEELGSFASPAGNAP